MTESKDLKYLEECKVSVINTFEEDIKLMTDTLNQIGHPVKYALEGYRLFGTFVKTGNRHGEYVDIRKTEETKLSKEHKKAVKEYLKIYHKIYGED